MKFQIDKWFGTASAVMGMLPVSCGDETAALDGKVLNISVKLRCDPHRLQGSDDKYRWLK